MNLKAYRPAAKQLNAQIAIAEQQQQKLLNGPSMGSIAERRGQINLADLPVKIVSTGGHNLLMTNLGQKQQQCRSLYELELVNGDEDRQIYGNNGGEVDIIDLLMRWPKAMQTAKWEEWQVELGN
jgi:hypothetical protein